MANSSGKSRVYKELGNKVLDSRVGRTLLVISLTGLYLFISLVVMDIIIPWLRLEFLWDGWISDGVITYDPPFWLVNWVFIISLFLMLISFPALGILRVFGYRLNIRKNFSPSLIATSGLMLLVSISMMFIFPLFKYRFACELSLALRTCRIYALWSIILLVGSILLQVISRRRKIQHDEN